MSPFGLRVKSRCVSTANRTQGQLAPARKFDMTRINERSDATAWQRRWTEWTQRRSIDFHLVEECDFKRGGQCN